MQGITSFCQHLSTIRHDWLFSEEAIFLDTGFDYCVLVNRIRTDFLISCRQPFSVLHKHALKSLFL